MSEINLSSEGLVTLRGQDIPDVVDGYFDCASNKLTSLEFGPDEAGGDYWCSFNKLTSLEYCATKIGAELFAHDNLITNLKGIHLQFKNGFIKKDFTVETNPIQSHVLGIILIPELNRFFLEHKDVQGIINRHLRTRDILECQEELIQVGFKEFAQL